MLETAEQRSRTMRAVKSADTTPELNLRKLLHRLGYRYRLHRGDLPGKPDIVFGPRRKVIFMHGCFWHGHDCRRGARTPQNNAAYWRDKIKRNIERDAANKVKLAEHGWAVMIVWECQLKDISALISNLHCFLADPQTGSSP
jgi:DNA mismatch endonuclease (patch repair protein)